MENCVFHPNHVSIEQCEVCNRPLCGLCLWYDAGGRRLCATHAREVEEVGGQALPPETYAEAIGNSLVVNDAAGVTDQLKNVPYRGNSQDLNALLALVIAFTTLGSCMGGAYCLPFVAITLGAVAYTNASKAVDPQRTRLLAGVSVGVAGFMLLAVLAYIMLIFAFFALAMLSAFTSP